MDTLRLFDFMLVAMIVFNLGALVLTNILVVQLPASSGMDFYEANPFLKDVVENHPYWAFVQFCGTWFIIIGGYLFVRDFVADGDLKPEIQILLGLLLVGGVIITGFDFFHDFGFFLGVVL